MMSADTEPCRFLDWDTEFFGKRIARLNGSRLYPDLAAAALEWCHRGSIDCLYFLADSDDPQTIWLAEEHHFKLVEVRYTFERSLTDWDPVSRPRDVSDVLIRAARLEDTSAIQEIARTSYIDSRFYFDPNFSEESWSRYYSTWAKKSCEGGAELALVAERQAEVVGYITGLVDRQKNEAIYELTGVRESVRRSGVGQELFRSGLDWYAAHHLPKIWVATQGRNIVTQRMIQRNGFLSKSCQLYYHKWFSK
jgi:dTDP-4-amino-4,6-dideoxy-D-galactose acyltransferase